MTEKSSFYAEDKSSFEKERAVQQFLNNEPVEGAIFDVVEDAISEEDFLKELDGEIIENEAEIVEERSKVVKSVEQYYHDITENDKEKTLKEDFPKAKKKEIASKGHYHSWKNEKEFYYRSLRQREYMQFFDENEDIAGWEHEPFAISYQWENKEKSYTPTFFVELKGGQKFVFELEGKEKYMKSGENQAKFDEAARLVTERGGQFRFIH